MSFTPRTDWKDFPDTSTLIRASDLIRIEQGVATAQAGVDALAPQPVPAAWINALSKRYDQPLTMVVFGDSRANGYNNGNPGGVTDLGDAFPGRLAQRFRARLGMAAGGRGFIQLRWLTNDQVPPKYAFAIPTWADGSVLDTDTSSTTGVIGSAWLGSGGNTARVPLHADCTSVEFFGISNRETWDVGWSVTMTGQSAATVTSGKAQADPYGVASVSLANPGSYVDVQCVQSDSAGGIHGLGVVEYVGDETAGVRVVNLALPGETAVHYAATVSGKEMFAALMEKLAPAVAVVELGANDVEAGNTSGDVTAAVSTLAALAPVGVVVTAPPDAGALSGVLPTWDRINTATRAADPTILVDLAARGGFSAPIWDGNYLSDGTHLNTSGNTAFADAIAAALPL